MNIKYCVECQVGLSEFEDLWKEYWPGEMRIAFSLPPSPSLSFSQARLSQACQNLWILKRILSSGHYSGFGGVGMQLPRFSTSIVTHTRLINMKLCKIKFIKCMHVYLPLYRLLSTFLFIKWKGHIIINDQRQATCHRKLWLVSPYHEPSAISIRFLAWGGYTHSQSLGVSIAVSTHRAQLLRAIVFALSLHFLSRSLTHKVFPSLKNSTCNIMQCLFGLSHRHSLTLSLSVGLSLGVSLLKWCIICAVHV